LKKLVDLILIGAPGSGKGSQSLKIKEKFGYRHLSTGDMLRAEVAKGSELGKHVAEIINSGRLVSDELVLSLLKLNCNSEDSFLFDGFPRNLLQAKMLQDEIFKKLNRDSLALYFKVNNEDLISRIVNRRTCKNCGTIFNLITKPSSNGDYCDNCDSTDKLSHRADDNEEVVRGRLNIFDSESKPLLDYYANLGKLKIVDASMSEEKLFGEISRLIN